MGTGEPDVGTTREQSPPRFTVLEPVVVPRECETIITEDPLAVSRWIDSYVSRESVVAFDVESKGTEHWLPDTYVVGFSLSTSGSAIYLDCNTLEGGFAGPAVRRLLNRLISRRVRLIAHNWFFDGAWLLRDHPKQFSQLEMYRCTYLSYKLTATEGWNNQQWSLKAAQLDLLGWQDTNELELDRWLVENGWVVGSVTKEFSERMNARARWGFYCSESNRNTQGAKKVRPSKGEMWRAPASILGQYCCLDSHSTWLLYAEVLSKAEERFPVLVDYTEQWMLILRKLIEQQSRGIELDVPRLERCIQEWERKCEAALEAFMSHPDVAPAAQEWFEARMKEEYWDREPERYKKPPKKPKEPAMYKKNGEVSKSWLKWNEERLPAWEYAVANPEQSKNWENWFERRPAVEAKCRLNLNSNSQLCWLFYDRLGYPVAKETENGEPSIDKKVVGLLGEPGRLLREYGIVDKERQYMQACYDVQHEGTLHPAFRVPGTLTGRLSGAGGLNIQQQPKAREYLECFRARKGFKWVQCDVTSLEKVVLAERSRDEALLNLYGPDARPGQDIYLHDAASLPGFREPLIEAGYCPRTSSAEFTAEIKRKFKGLRKKVKPASLGFGYGLGPKKYRADMLALGYEMTEDEARAVHRAYWTLYSGTKEWERELQRQHRKNRGWILNGIGRPLGIHEDYTHDIVNRDTQSTGHDLLIIWLTIVIERLDAEGIEWYPIILDFHDETIIEVREEQATRAARLMDESFLVLNELMGNTIPLTGDGEVCNNLADIKVED